MASASSFCLPTLLLAIGALESVAARCTNSSLASKVNHDISGLNKQTHNETDCSLADNEYSADYCIAAAVFFIIGFIFCFFGKRLFKIVLFLSGVVVAGGLTFFLLYEYLPCSTPSFSWVVVGTAGGIGLLAGILTVRLYYVGIFAIGATGGALAMLGILSYMQSSYVENHRWLPIVLVTGVALVCGLLAFKLQENVIAIPVTALIGAILLMYALDYYVENTAAVSYTFNLLKSGAVRPHCVQTWIMLGLWPFVFGAGILLQCIKTGGKRDVEMQERKHLTDGEDDDDFSV